MDEVYLEGVKILVVMSAFCYAIFKFSHERKRSASHENLKILISIYDDLYENPDRLKCYGFSKSDLEEKGISTEEFIYLLKDFTAGMLYYDVKFESKNGMFPKGSYRYNLCSLESTRKAWPFLRFFFEGYPYGRLYEKTISFHHGTVGE